MKRLAILFPAALFLLSCALPVSAQEAPKSAPMQMYHVLLVKKGPEWKSQLVNDETDVEFILILNVETKYEALQVLESAPNYKNGMYTADIYSMFAPKGLVIRPQE